MSKDLTRRALLRGSAIGMVGIASTALLAACGGSAAVTGAASTAAGTTAAATTVASTPAGTTGTAASTVAQTSSVPATTSAPASTTALATASSAAAPAAKAGATTLHIMDWALSTADSQARWAKVKAAFLLKYPDVTIQEDFSNDFWKKLPVAVASGTPPDVSSLRRQAEFPELAPYNAVIDLSPYMARSKVLLKEDFYPSTLTMQSIAGKLYALPTTQNPFGMFYNKDLFDAKGVKYPDTTWDYQDWQDAAVKLNQFQNDQWTQIGGLMPSWWTIHYAGNHDQAMWQGGPTQPGVCTRVNYDQPVTIQAYQWYQGAVCKDHLSPTDAQQTTMKTDFANGNAAMLFSYDERSDQADKIKNKFKWDWTLPPLGDKQKPRIVTNIGGGIAIYTGSKVKDVGWNYLEFTNDPAFLNESVKANGARDIYSNRKVQESADYLASSIPPGDKKLLTEAINSGRFFPEPSWEMQALKVTPPALPKGTPDPSSCGADAPTLLRSLAAADNGALKAAGVSVCP